MNDLSPEMRRILAARARETRLGADRDRQPNPPPELVERFPGEEPVELVDVITTWTPHGMEARGRSAADGAEALVVGIRYIGPGNATFLGVRTDNQGPGPRIYRPVEGWAARVDG